MKLSVNLFLLASLTIVCLTACGIKPSKLTAPQGEDKDTFERTYPDPSTFPRPESK